MTDYTIKRFHEYSDNDLIKRLREYADKAESDYISSRAFSDATGIAETTITNHFGTWKTFCEKAGVSPRYIRSIDQIVLFDNLDFVWNKLGRQPRAKEMKQPLSPISISRYQKVIQKPWYDICVDFLSWKSGASVHEIMSESQTPPKPSKTANHATRRVIPLALRYAILKRDGFACSKCGRSPATDRRIELHIDHVISWANGGETIESNLQTLCSECNLGKSNKHDG